MALRNYEAPYPKDPDEAVSRLHEENRDVVKRIYETAHKEFEICQGMEICLAMEHLIENLGDKSNGFIEIGSAYGGSFYCWGSIVTGGPAVSIDKPVGAVVEKYGVTTPNDHENVARRNRLWNEYFPGRIHIVDGYSQEPGVIAQVEKILGDHKVDFLFIDGDHSYNPTLLDVKNYSRFVRKGGIVGFHDIYHPAHRYECGKVFQEMPNRKWETGYDNHCAAHQPTGIGLVYID